MTQKGRRCLALLTALALVIGTVWTPQGSQTGYAYADTGSAAYVGTGSMACGCDTGTVPGGEEAFPAGNGTADSPYEIHTAAQLSHVRSHLNGQYFVLAEDIDLNAYCTTDERNPNRTEAGGIGWKPIGGDGTTREGRPFTGSFDGRGHVISNMSIKAVTTGKDWNQTYGLFGFTKNSAVIQNLVMQNPQIEISGNNHFEAGAVLGLNKAAGNPLNNIAVLGGSIRGLGQGAHRLGGVLGCSQDNRAVITNCCADTEISSESANGDCRLGGIMGGSGSSKNERLEACVFTGMIEKTAGKTGGVSGEGGTLTSCWYDSDKVVQEGGLGTGKPEADLQDGTLELGSEWTVEAGTYPCLNISMTASQSADDSQSAENLNTTATQILVCGCDKETLPAGEEGFTAGDGTVDSPYEVQTAAQLSHVRSHLASHFIVTADIDLAAYCTEEAGNPDRTADGGMGWKPIGGDGTTREGRPFTGSFDGQGHVISNLTIQAATTGRDWNQAYGLFGFTKNNGAIKNLVLQNPQITISGNNHFEAGAVLGLNKAVGVPLDNVAVLGGSIRGFGSGAQRLGGVLGCSQDNRAAIRNCYADVEISSESANKDCRLGGITGGSGSSKNERFEDCVYTGVISKNGGNIGGISGEGGILSNCAYNADKLTQTAGVGTGMTERELSDGTPALGDEWVVSRGFYPYLSISAALGTEAFEVKTPEPTCGCEEGRLPAGEEAFTAGSGTADSPFEIATAAQLSHVRSHLQSHFILTKDIDLSAYCTTEEGNPDRISAGRIGWKPIGGEGTTREGRPFTGSFDGQGHVISNMTIQAATTGRDWNQTYGLFGFAKNGAVIKNLELQNPQVTISGNNAFEAGAVLGLNKASGVSLENLSVRGGLIQGLGQGAQRLGGVLGCSQDNRATVKNCYADTEIRSSSANGDCRLGGIMGGSGSSKNERLENCLYMGKITKNAGRTGGTSGEGGILTNCWFRSDQFTQTGGLGTGKTERELQNGTLTLGSAWTVAKGYYPYLTLFAAEGAEEYKAAPFTGKTYRITVKTAAPLFGNRSVDRYQKNDYDVKLALTGEKGTSEWITINPYDHNVTPLSGQEDVYNVELEDVGLLNGIQYYSELPNRNRLADWYIDWIRVDELDSSTGAVKDSDTISVRNYVINPQVNTAPLAYRYKFTVKTGGPQGAGTDSNIYVRLIGSSGEMTEEREISELVKGNAFERNSTDTCSVSFDKNIGTITGLQLRSDCSWAASDWFVDWIRVEKESAAKGTAGSAEFQLNQWIADTAPKRFTAGRAGEAPQYRFTVKTGTDSGAGTDSNIYVRLTGDKGTTEEREISELVNGNAFEKGNTDTLVATFDKNVGTVKKLELRSDMKWAGADWKVDSIEVTPVSGGNEGQASAFQINQWITDKDWKTFSNDPADSTQYKFTVKTGNALGAGTDSHIYVRLIGSKGTTNEIEVSEIISGNAFEKGNTDTFVASFDKNIGTIQKLQLRSDMKWAGAEWLLDSVKVEPVYQNQVQSGAKTFQINQWIQDKNTLTYSVDSKSITQYKFTVKTGKLSWFPKGEGTDSNIYVKLVGSRGTTNEVEISELVSGNAFERGNTDTCNVVFQNDIGTLQKIQVRSDMKWAGADWYVEYIQVQPLLNGQAFGSAKTFGFNQWIDSTRTYEKQ